MQGWISCLSLLMLSPSRLWTLLLLMNPSIPRHKASLFTSCQRATNTGSLPPLPLQCLRWKKKPCHSSPCPNPILSLLPACWWNMLLAGGRKFASRQPRDGPVGGWSRHWTRFQRGRNCSLGRTIAFIVSVLRKVTFFSMTVSLNPFDNGFYTHTVFIYTHRYKSQCSSV